MTMSESMHRYRYRLLLTLLLVAGLYGSVLAEMARQWYRDDTYSYGVLIPLVSAWFVYLRRTELLECEAAPSLPGLAIVAAALAQFLLASLARENFTERSSLVLLLAGIVVCLFGPRVFALLRLPILYLIFMVPLPYLVYNAITFPLKLFVATVAVTVLQGLGIAVVGEGNVLMLPNITLEVADACSGIRSLISLLAAATAYAFLLRTSPLRRWGIALAAIPIALFTNALRVVATGILAARLGGDAATGFMHETAGMAIFGLALLLLFTVGRLLTGGTT